MTLAVDWALKPNYLLLLLCLCKIAELPGGGPIVTEQLRRVSTLEFESKATDTDKTGRQTQTTHFNSPSQAPQPDETKRRRGRCMALTSYDKPDLFVSLLNV